jgi:Spy/CpxP family protein refolding chaperone
MRQQIGRIVSFAAALLLAGAAAWAQEPQPPGPDGQGPGRWRARGPQQAMTRMLNLSDDQQEKLREILEQQRPQREALHEKMSANREALHQLLESGSADANAVGELVLEGRRLREEGQALRETEQKSIRAILTPDQQKKFDTMQDRLRKRGPRGPGGFGPGGFGPGGFGGGDVDEGTGGPGARGFTKQPPSNPPNLLP